MVKPEQILVRPVEAAAMLSISRTSVYELLQRGDLKGVRVGGRILRIPVSEIRRIAGGEQPEAEPR